MGMAHLSETNRALIERICDDSLGPLEEGDYVEMGLLALNRLLDAARAEGAMSGVTAQVVAGGAGGARFNDRR